MALVLNSLCNTNCMKNMFPITALLCALSLYACNNNPEPKQAPIPVVIRDTVYIEKPAENTSIANVLDTPEVVKPATEVVVMQEEKKTPAKPQVQKPVAAANDTTYYYYVNKKVSVKITPWVNGERKVLLYDLYGNNTYEIEEVRHSYSVRAELKFHDNGAVKTASIHTNPGASMYMYLTTITFNTINEPEQKHDETSPVRSLEETMKPWEYWDKKTRTWKKQEVMEGAPVVK